MYSKELAIHPSTYPFSEPQNAQFMQNNALSLSFPAFILLHFHPQAQHALCIFNNLVTPQLALSVHPVHEAYRHFRDLEPHRLRAHHHLHLEGVPLALRARHDLLQHLLLVQPEAPREVAHTGPQHRVGEQVRPARDDLALEVPAEDAAVAGVARARDDVVVPLGLQLDHARDEFRVVREVGVHDDDEVARRELQAVHVRRPQPQLARPRLQLDPRRVRLLQLLRDLLRAVRRTVVDDDDFPIEVAAKFASVLALYASRGSLARKMRLKRVIGNSLFSEHLG